MIFECWAIHIGDLQLLCKTACSFHVNNTNKGNSAVLNWSPHGCSLSPPLRSSSPRFIHSDKKLVMRHISGLQPVQLCKYHSALWGPIRLFRDSPWLCSCYIQPPHLVRTFDLINHYGFHKLRVKSASSYSLYFELNPRVYIQAFSVSVAQINYRLFILKMLKIFSRATKSSTLSTDNGSCHIFGICLGFAADTKTVRVGINSETQLSFLPVNSFWSHLENVLFFFLFLFFCFSLPKFLSTASLQTRWSAVSNNASSSVGP